MEENSESNEKSENQENVMSQDTESDKEQSAKNSGCEDDDLEDGEIETDDDDDNDNNETIIDTKQTTKTITSNIIDTNTLSSSNNNVPSSKERIEQNEFSNLSKLISSNTSNKVDIPFISEKSSNAATKASDVKKSKIKFIEDDWAGNVQNAIAAALKKEGVMLPKSTEHERDRESLHSDDGGLDGDSGIARLRNKAGKKRKKQRESDRKAKKKMKHHNDSNDEIDDYEMLCIRGGSPPLSNMTQMHHHPPPTTYYDSDNSYTSYDSYESQEYKIPTYQEKRQVKKIKDRRRKGDRDDSRKKGGGGHEKRKRMNDDHDGGDDGPKSHDIRGPRKLELCKFYLMECCAKKEKCSYMHSDFPCKYYYLGMECIYKGACKFSHGKPLTEQLRNILLKHIETAPKEILGNFRRINREHAIALMNTTHAKLCAEQGIENTLAPSASTTTSITTVNSTMIPVIKSPNEQQQQNSTSIPSLLDIIIKPPIPSPRKDDKLSPNTAAILKGEKQRKSRWCDNSMSSSSEFSALPIMSGGGPHTAQPGVVTKTSLSVPDVLSLRNLTGVITPEQIEKLAAMGIESLEQVNQLTVAQLNSLGLTIAQIGEIQLNSLNIQKLGLISATTSSEKSSYLGNITASSATSSSATTSTSALSPVTVASLSSSTTSHRQGSGGNTLEFINPSGLYSDSATSLGNQSNPSQDIDMRFLVGTTTTNVDKNLCSSPKNSTSATTLISSGIASPDAIQPIRTGLDYASEIRNDSVNSSNSIDYSQYLKDSNIDAEKTDLNDILLDKDDALNEDEPELLIDESWMDSNDEEKDTNMKNDNQNNDIDETLKTTNEDKIAGIPKASSPDIWTPTSIHSNNQAYKISSSSYCNASDEENWDTDDDSRETKKKSKHNEEHLNVMPFNAIGGEHREFRGDPRLQKNTTFNAFGDYNTTSSSILSNINDSMYTSNSSNMDNINDNWMVASSSSSLLESSNSITNTTVPKYQRVSIYDGNPSEIGGDDENSATVRKKFDKDMRMSSFIDSTNSDIDLRLPFKPVMTNYTPATEIDGSISSHSPIPYKVFEIEIPKPDYSEIRRSIPVSEKTLDPRLRRIFCLKESITAGSNELEGNVNNQTMDIAFSNSNRSNNSGNASSSNKRDDLNEKTNTVVSISTSSPRIDPRRRKESQDTLVSGNSGSSSGDRNQGVDIKMILQKSNWYKNLNSKFKIMVNQQLALVSTELKKFHQNPTPNKIFDMMSFLGNNQYLQQILTNLSIFIDVNGQLKELEGDNDGDGTSSMPGMMGIGGISGMDPNVATSVQQMVNVGAGLVMPSVNGPAQLGGILSNMPGSAAGMYMRGVPTLNMGAGGNATGIMSQFRPPRYENIRPGLLGIAPGIQFNPFDPSNTSVGNNMTGINESGDSGFICGGGGNEEQNNFNAFLGGNSGVGSLFDQNNFFNRTGGGVDGGNMQSTSNRGMRNNFRQGGTGRNQNDRWNAGSGTGGNNNRDGNNLRRNFDNKNRSGDIRREKPQKS